MAQTFEGLVKVMDPEYHVALYRCNEFREVTSRYNFKTRFWEPTKTPKTEDSLALIADLKKMPVFKLNRKKLLNNWNLENTNNVKGLRESEIGRFVSIVIFDTDKPISGGGTWERRKQVFSNGGKRNESRTPKAKG